TGSARAFSCASASTAGTSCRPRPCAPGCRCRSRPGFSYPDDPWPLCSDFVLVQPAIAVKPRRWVRDVLAVLGRPLRIAAHALLEVGNDFVGFRVEPLSEPRPHCCGFTNSTGIRLPEVWKAILNAPLGGKGGIRIQRRGIQGRRART